MNRYSVEMLIQAPGQMTAYSLVKETDDIKKAVRTCRAADTVARAKYGASPTVSYRVVDWDLNRAVYVATPMGREWVHMPPPASSTLMRFRADTVAKFRMLVKLMDSRRVAPLPA